MKLWKILVADDMPSNRLLLEGMLRKRGCCILEAANGQEALEIALREDPDLILIDLMMPVMNGWEAIRHIRAAEGAIRTVPIIAVTAAPQKEAEHALTLGCDYVVAKPIRPRPVWILIHQILTTHTETSTPTQ